MAINRKMLSRVGAAAVVVGLAGAGYLFLQYTHRAKASATAAAEEGVPVIAAVAQKQDVPLVVRGIGTVQAYNMVVIKTRVDGAIVKVSFSEGQDVKAGDPLFQIDPRPFQAALDQAQAAKERNEAQLVERPARPQSLRHAQQGGLSVAPELRRADGDRARAQGLDRRRRGGDRQCQAQSRLCRHPRALRRPHRHAPGRYRQSRPGGAGDQPGQHHPGEADLRQFHGAAERQRPGARAAGRRPARRHCPGRRCAGRAGARRGLGDRQPDRHHRPARSASRRSSRMPTRGCGRDSSSTSACCSPSARASSPCRNAR